MSRSLTSSRSSPGRNILPWEPDFQLPPTALKPTKPTGKSFGGARKRYQESRGELVRCYDPISGQSVSFKSELARENWLLRRFSPSVWNTTPLGEPHRVIQRGAVLTAHFALLTSLRDGRELLDTVAPIETYVHEDLRCRLTDISRAHGCCWELRTREVIRANPLLLDNLDRIRRKLTLSRGRWQGDVNILLTHCIKSPVETVGSLGPRLLRRIDHQDSELVDLLVIQGYLSGRIQLNISERPYGQDTLIHDL